MTCLTIKWYLLWLSLKIYNTDQSEFWILLFTFSHWFIDSVHFAFHPSCAQMRWKNLCSGIQFYLIGRFMPFWTNCFKLPEFLIPLLVTEKRTLLFLAFIRVLASELVSMGFCFQSWHLFLFSICYINRVTCYRVPKLWWKWLTCSFLGVTDSTQLPPCPLPQFGKEMLLYWPSDAEALATGSSEAGGVVRKSGGRKVVVWE